MIKELRIFEKLVVGTALANITTIIEDVESKEYFGYNFETENMKFKFRKSKITPKKNGQFVTLWKRNAKLKTEPFTEADNFDFYIIVCEENENYGFFLFPKSELIKRQILSTDIKEGKRGFRVYPKWTKTENKQAEKTQDWQNKYFVTCTPNTIDYKKRVLEILFLK